MMQPLKIYSNTISCSKPFTEEMPFTFHFATFQSLRAENPELLAQSFTQGPIPTLKSCTNFEVDPVLMDVVEILHKQTISFGEQNVWQTRDGETEITIFIEVLVPGIFPGRYQQVEALIRNYWSLLLPLRIKKQCTADQEIRDYIYPGSDTKTSDERRVAAQALGLLARQGLGYFLLMVVQDVRWSWESQFAVHVKEEGCASTIQPRSGKSERI
ncbi:uncharacterized protein RCO7_11215 [Rhynchosporium graminicola]|uniref:Uncharacterized protein n=1 Tax=Rhynchosporium graminicola TaxID=2792576 RepID=A0A1E1LB24_9HELO|nr:uncharacterized protein RCO7_11215 [Rhynchosporium commune]